MPTTCTRPILLLAFALIGVLWSGEAPWPPARPVDDRVAPAPGARVWYVAPGGDDTADGRAPATALRTPQRAADQTGPGDVVCFLDGTYTAGHELLRINRSGAPDRPITYRNAPGSHPIFTATDGWNHIEITASHIVLDGLQVIGNREAITHDQAMAVYNHIATAAPGKEDWQAAARTNTNGISIDGREARKAKVVAPHHLVIRRCTVAKTPAAGISAMEADYILIEDNVVHETCWTTIFGASGISVLHSQDVDQERTIYKNIVRRNRSWRNRTDVPWIEVKRISDGNGIIIDDLRNAQITAAPYQGRTLVENNVCWENGGSGIHAFSSDRVDLVNNTVVHNNQRPELRWGNLFASNAADCLILNNIVVASPGGVVNSGDSTRRVISAQNLYWGATPAVVGTGDLVADPQFIAPETGDFRIREDSPAVDRGTTTRAPREDLLGQPRPQGRGIDLGAYETAAHAGEPAIPAALDLAAILAELAFKPETGDAVHGSPVIDGEIDRLWESAPFLHTSKSVGTGTGAATARTRLLWDAKGLYVLSEVVDRDLHAVGPQPWLCDSVEWFVDPDGRMADQYHDGVGQYRVSYQGERTPGSQTAPGDFTASSVRTATGYRIEAALPWRGRTVSVGSKIGFDVQVNDADGGGSRIGCRTWCDPTGSGWNLPARFGVVTLVGIHQAVLNADAPAAADGRANPGPAADPR